MALAKKMVDEILAAEAAAQKTADEAQHRAAEIISEARGNAERLVAEARREAEKNADKILEQAKLGAQSRAASSSADNSDLKERLLAGAAENRENALKRAIEILCGE